MTSLTGPLPLLSAHQAHEWLTQHEAILIDVRHPTAHQALHIANTLHVPDPDQIPQIITENPTERVILLCQNGNHAKQISAALLLQQNEAMEGVLFYILDGGMNGWRNANLPVVRDSDSATGLALERQVQITLGVALLVCILFSWMFSGLWLFLVIAIAVGQIYSGLTGWYGFQQLVLMLPWNKHT